MSSIDILRTRKKKKNKKNKKQNTKNKKKHVFPYTNNNHREMYHR